jgi:hypothetical protein
LQVQDCRITAAGAQKMNKLAFHRLEAEAAASAKAAEQEMIDTSKMRLSGYETCVYKRA